MMQAIPQEDPDIVEETAADDTRLVSDSGVFLSVETSGDSAPKYTSRLTIVLPIGQIFIGVCCILVQVWVVVNEERALYHAPLNVAPGIWCGTLYVICGLMGLAASKWKHKGFIITFMVLSVLSAGSVVILCAVSVTSLLHDRPNYETQEGTSHQGIAQLQSAFTGNVILLCLASLELVISVWASLICGRVVCKCTWGSANPVSYRPLLAH